jgi:multiple sugar transport system permease protein
MSTCVRFSAPRDDLMLDLAAPRAKIVFASVAMVLGLFLFFPLFWMITTSFKPRASCSCASLAAACFADLAQLYRRADAQRSADLSAEFADHRRRRRAAHHRARDHGGVQLREVQLSRPHRADAADDRGADVPLRGAADHALPGDAGARPARQRLGLTLSYIVFALPSGTYMLYSYFVNIPTEIIEAARADGASELRILARIVLPLSIPGLVTVGLYASCGRGTTCCTR